MNILLMCALALGCPFNAENVLRWDPVPTATSYNVYVSERGSPMTLFAEGLPCCTYAPVRGIPYQSFPIWPGTVAVFGVTAVNAAGESGFSNLVGVEVAQFIYDAGVGGWEIAP